METVGIPEVRFTASLTGSGGGSERSIGLGAAAIVAGNLIHALRDRGGKYDLQTMCEGGGTANVTIVEAL